MDTLLLKEVRDCLCGERSVYHYYDDKFAVDVLNRLMHKKGEMTVQQLKQSHYAPLLNRPVVKKLLAMSGSGKAKLDLGKLEYMHHEPFVLTLDEWGSKDCYGWAQLSRPGTNLVLQLNLSGFWAKQMNQLLEEKANDYFGYGHPICEKRDVTLAWARLDFDFDTDEVLVEEVQSDLIRFARRWSRRAKWALENKQERVRNYHRSFNAKQMLRVCGALLDAFDRNWQEIMLAATLEFAFDELGFSQVFYHSFETGNQFKKMGDWLPPKSMYSKLPKRFCFQETNKVPEFLKNEKKLKRLMRKTDNMRFFHTAA